MTSCCLSCRWLWYRPAYAIRHVCRLARLVPQDVWAEALKAPAKPSSCPEWRERPAGLDPQTSPF